MKKTLIALALAVSALPVFTVAPAEAGRCKQPLPFGGWTWVPCTAPAPRKNVRQAAPPKRTYYFTIYNVDKTSSVTYYLKGTEKYKLGPGRSRKHSYSSRSKYLMIEFDKYTQSGRWESREITIDMSRDDLDVWYDNDTDRIRINYL